MDGAVRGTRLGVRMGWRVVRLLLLQERKGQEEKRKRNEKQKKKIKEC